MSVPEAAVSLFRSWLLAADLPAPDGPVAVGWSGGADSTALLLAMKTGGYAVEAWHVDHGWRGESAREAELLRRRAELWQIPFVSDRLSSDGSGKSEAQARKGRYRCFQRWSGERGVNLICIAHHREDQAETVCMRMLQGAGPGGCCGMLARRNMGAMVVARPLLHVPRGELRRALRIADIPWLEDPSNRDPKIWRNRIRHQLFPAIRERGVDPVDLFLRWGKTAKSVLGDLDNKVARIFEGRLLTSPDRLSLSWSAWEQATPAVRARILQHAMVQLFGEGVTPGRRHIELVEQWMDSGGRGGLDLSRCRLYREAGRLYLRLQL